MHEDDDEPASADDLLSRLATEDEDELDPPDASDIDARDDDA